MKTIDYFLLELIFNNSLDERKFVMDLKKSISNLNFTLNDLLEVVPNKDIVLKMIDNNFHDFINLFQYNKLFNKKDKIKNIYMGLPDNYKVRSLIECSGLYPDDLFLEFIDIESKNIVIFMENNKVRDINSQFFEWHILNSLNIEDENIKSIYFKLSKLFPKEFKYIYFDNLNLNVLNFLFDFLNIIYLENTLTRCMNTNKDLNIYYDIVIKSINECYITNGFDKDLGSFDACKDTLYKFLNHFHDDKFCNYLFNKNSNLKH